VLEVIYFTPAQTGDTVAEFWDEFELVAQLEWDGTECVVSYFEGFDELQLDMELFDAMVNRARSRLGLYNGPR
jgi:hypothetical protein